VRQRVTFAKVILLAAVLQGAAPRLAAQRDGIARLFPPRPAGFVTDVPGALDADVVRRIDAKAERLKQVTGAELAVVVLPTIGDYAAVDVAVAIGRAWGVGAATGIGDRTRNAGIVILLVPRRADDPNSGQIFIATGQGLEGIVTDLRAGTIRDLMRPAFGRGEYASGLELGVGALASLIARGFGITDSALLAGGELVEEPAGRAANPGQTFKMILVVIILLILIANNSRRGRRRGRIFWGGGFGGWGGGGFGGGGGGFGGFGGGGGFSGGGSGGRF
jgi:uncharacterized protein